MSYALTCFISFLLFMIVALIDSLIHLGVWGNYLAWQVGMWPFVVYIISDEKKKK
jgi:hypothetical protein